jgi:hypothetical protein
MGSLTSHFGNCPAQADGRAGGGGRGGAAPLALVMACQGEVAPHPPWPCRPTAHSCAVPPPPPVAAPARATGVCGTCSIVFRKLPRSQKAKVWIVDLDQPSPISPLPARRAPASCGCGVRCTRKAGNRGVNPSQHGENAAAPTGAGLWAGCAKRKQGPLSKTRPGYRRGRLSKVRKALAQFFRGKKTKNLSRTFFF